MKFKILLFALAGLLLSCSGKKDYTLKVKLLKLKESDIYDKNLVADVIFDAEENNISALQKKSRALFLKGVDLYKNKKNPVKAISFFKKSILIFPDAKTYYELGNALLDSEQGMAGYEESLKAYEVAEGLHFQPIANVYFKEACANNMLDRLTPQDEENMFNYRTVNCLRMAFTSGYTDTVAIQKEPKLTSILSDPDYKNMVNEVLLKIEKDEAGHSVFETFKNSFPSEENSFEIPLDKVDMKDFKESISYEFSQYIPEMENASFGRDVSHDFFYVANVGSNENYTAVVYTSVSYYGETMQPVMTTLTTYNNQGEIISKKLISCQCSAEKVKTSKIENNTIQIRDYKISWTQPIDKVSFEENKIASSELLAEAKYKIDDNGKIIIDDVPANYNDSTVVARK